MKQFHHKLIQALNMNMIDTVYYFDLRQTTDNESFYSQYLKLFVHKIREFSLIQRLWPIIR